MSDDIRIQDAALIAIAALSAHPMNARRGNVDMLMGSLQHHGQYRPIVVNQHNVVLAGHHLVQAAKRLGWTELAAVQVETTDAMDRRIMLADNRTSDLAAYDDAMLLAFLEAMPDLDGTGYGPADIAALDSIIAGDEPEMPESSTPEEPDANVAAEIRIGPLYRFRVMREPFEAWRDTHLKDVSKGKAVGVLKEMLDWPKPVKPAKSPPRISGTFETVPIMDLQCHPVNPREGDVGAIIQSLEINGQYRPIIANRRTHRVIVGNHTYVAARTLGWDRIAVHWVDVDEIEESKILLIDNRTSDLATYDTDALVALLMAEASWGGTGYTAEDVEEITAGGKTRPGPKPTGQTAIVIDDYRWRTPTDLYDQWADFPRDPIASLGLPYNAVLED